MLKKLIIQALLFSVSMPLRAIYITFERQANDTTSYVISHSYINTVRMACLETAEPATKNHIFASGRLQFSLDVNTEDQIVVSVQGQNSHAHNRVFTFYLEPVTTQFLLQPPLLGAACHNAGF